MKIQHQKILSSNDAASILNTDLITAGYLNNNANNNMADASGWNDNVRYELIDDTCWVAEIKNVSSIVIKSHVFC